MGQAAFGRVQQTAIWRRVWCVAESRRFRGAFSWISDTAFISNCPEKKDGEPVDKDLWGELEPEEGSLSSHFLRVCVGLIFIDRGGRGRRRGRRGRGRGSRDRSGRWPADAIGHGNAVRHDERCVDCRWRTGNTRLFGVEKGPISFRGDGIFWAQVVVSGCA